MITKEHRFVCCDNLYDAAELWWEVCEQRPDYDVTICYPLPDGGDRCVSTARHRWRWQLWDAAK